jgi:hypothetical protein
MYCPQCKTEYRSGFTECADCRVPLLPGDPPQPEHETEFDPNMDLVVVFEANDPVLIAMAKGALEEAEIPYFSLGQITRLVNDVDPMLRKTIRIQVAADQVEKAHEALALLETPAPLAEGVDPE